MSASIYRKIYWKIDNVAKEVLYRYSKNKSISKGFSINHKNGSKSQWIAEFYPNSDTTCELYLFKNRVDDDNIDILKARLYINTADGQEFIDEINAKVFDLEENEGYCFENLFTPCELFNESNSYLQNESLTFVIEFELHHIDAQPTISPSKKSLSIVDYEKLLSTENLSDFTIVCSDKEEIPIHRVFIALNCHVLMDMIDAEMAESSNKLILSDISSSSMQAILRFIYTGTIEKNLDVSMNLLYGAEKFQLKDLKSLCIDLLNKNIYVNNVLETLEIANYYNEAILEENCIEYIKMKLERLTDLEKWRKLSTMLTVKIINSISKHPIIINLKGSL